MGSIERNTPTLPIVDLSEWHKSSDPKDQMAVAKQLIAACRSTGFAYIANHGIPQSHIDRAFAESARLFNMSDEDKIKADHPEGYDWHRGYQSIGRERSANFYARTAEEKAAAEKIADVRETFDMGSEKNAREPNIWYPEDVMPGFKEWALQFYEECTDVAWTVLEVVALGIGVEKDDLLRHHSREHNHLRWAHYPAVPAARLEKKEAVRLAPHADFGTITLVFQDEVGGLEVKNPFEEGGDFIHADPIKGALVFNVGDYLMRWSNDILLSNQHRVGIPPLADLAEGEERMTRERYSLPFFVLPNYDATIETFPACIDEDHPRKYDPISIEEYKTQKFKSMAGG